MEVQRFGRSEYSLGSFHALHGASGHGIYFLINQALLIDRPRLGRELYNSVSRQPDRGESMFN